VSDWYTLEWLARLRVRALQAEADRERLARSAQTGSAGHRGLRWL